MSVAEVFVCGADRNQLVRTFAVCLNSYVESGREDDHVLLWGLTTEPSRRCDWHGGVGEQVADAGSAHTGRRVVTAAGRSWAGLPERSTLTRVGSEYLRCASGRVSISSRHSCPYRYLCAGIDRTSQPPRIGRRVHRLRFRAGECHDRAGIGVGAAVLRSPYGYLYGGGASRVHSCWSGPIYASSAQGGHQRGLVPRVGGAAVDSHRTTVGGHPQSGRRGTGPKLR